MLYESVLATTRGTDFGGVQHFFEGHGEFSLGRLCVARSRLIRRRVQLRLSLKRGDKSIGRWCRSIPWYHSAQVALSRFLVRKICRYESTLVLKSAHRYEGPIAPSHGTVHPRVYGMLPRRSAMENELSRVVKVVVTASLIENWIDG